MFLAPRPPQRLFLKEPPATDPLLGGASPREEEMKFAPASATTPLRSTSSDGASSTSGVGLSPDSSWGYGAGLVGATMWWTAPSGAGAGAAGGKGRSKRSGGNRRHHHHKAAGPGEKRKQSGGGAGAAAAAAPGGAGGAVSGRGGGARSSGAGGGASGGLSGEKDGVARLGAPERELSARQPGSGLYLRPALRAIFGDVERGGKEASAAPEGVPLVSTASGTVDEEEDEEDEEEEVTRSGGIDDNGELPAAGSPPYLSGNEADTEL